MPPKYRLWDITCSSMLTKDWKIHFKGGEILGVSIGDTWCSGNDVILMQFTGLFDKNNQPIYEGDVVKGYKDWVGEIKWCRSGYDEILAFHPINKEGHYNHYYGGWKGEEFEVIGNIYENPDLLPN